MFLPPQFVSWSGTPRIHHYFQVCFDWGSFTFLCNILYFISILIHTFEKPHFTLIPPCPRTPIPLIQHSAWCFLRRLLATTTAVGLCLLLVLVVN